MFDPFILFARNLIKHRIKDFNFLTIDPGLANIGWCLCTFKDFNIIDFGKLSLEPTTNIYHTDVRFKIISEYIENVLMKYNVNIVCIEKISFTIGKYSFAEQLLLKSVGIIQTKVMCEEKYIFEVSNRLAQSVLLDKARNVNKKIIFEYVQNIMKQQNSISDYDFRRIFTKSKNDICDAIFLSYAFRYIILSKM